MPPFATPTYVLVHGFPGGAEDAHPTVAELRSRGIPAERILTPDLRGFGAHTDPTLGFDELWVPAQATALERLLAGRGDVVLVGHDVGGPVALELARRLGTRVRGLVLASCNLLRDPPLPGPFVALGAPVLGPVVRTLAMSGPSLRVMARMGRRSGPLPRRNPAVEVRAIRSIFATALVDPDRHFAASHAALASYAGDVTFVFGSRDPFFDLAHARRQAAVASRATLHELDEVGHFPLLEAPRTMADLILATAGAAPLQAVDGQDRVL